MAENIYYKTVGNGPNCLLLLHPYPVNSKFFERMSNFVPDNWIAIIPDLPAFGQSPAILPQENYTLDNIAKLLEKLLRNIEGKIVLGGVSMGGYISLAVTRLFPDRINGLILMNTRDQADGDGGIGRQRVIQMINAGNRNQYIQDLLPKLLGKNHLQDQEWIDVTNKLIDETSNEALILSSGAMGKRKDHSKMMEELLIPKLLITGADDVITGEDIMGEMNHRYQNSNMVIIENAGHFSPFEQPEMVAREIYEFLEVIS